MVKYKSLGDTDIENYKTTGNSLMNLRELDKKTKL